MYRRLGKRIFDFVVASVALLFWYVLQIFMAMESEARPSNALYFPWGPYSEKAATTTTTTLGGPRLVHADGGNKKDIRE